MTTVAFDGKTVSADSRGSDDALAFNVQKLHWLPTGQVVGLAGDLSAAFAMVRWMQGGEVGVKPSHKEVALLVVGPDGAYMADGAWPPFPVSAPIAMGSGGKAAMVAMNLGKNSRQAVAEAIKVDSNSQGPIVTIDIAHKPKAKTRGASAPAAG